MVIRTSVSGRRTGPQRIQSSTPRDFHSSCLSRGRQRSINARRLRLLVDSPRTRRRAGRFGRESPGPNESRSLYRRRGRRRPSTWSHRWRRSFRSAHRPPFPNQQRIEKTCWHVRPLLDVKPVRVQESRAAEGSHRPETDATPADCARAEFERIGSVCPGALRAHDDHVVNHVPFVARVDRHGRVQRLCQRPRTQRRRLPK